MIKLLRKKFALSEKGARDMIKAFVANTVYDIVLMFPVALLYFMVRDLLNGGMNVLYLRNIRQPRAHFRDNVFPI